MSEPGKMKISLIIIVLLNIDQSNALTPVPVQWTCVKVIITLNHNYVSMHGLYLE